MALRVCTACTAAYAVGLPCCPQCGSTDYQEDSMPKITGAGASYEPGAAAPSAAIPPADDETGAAAAGAAQAAPPAAAAAGESLTPEPEATAEAAGTAPAARAQPKKAGDA